jgi:hypothetical protein
MSGRTYADPAVYKTALENFQAKPYPEFMDHCGFNSSLGVSRSTMADVVHKSRLVQDSICLGEAHMRQLKCQAISFDHTGKSGQAQMSYNRATGQQERPVDGAFFLLNGRDFIVSWMLSESTSGMERAVLLRGLLEQWKKDSGQDTIPVFLSDLCCADMKWFSDAWKLPDNEAVTVLLDLFHLMGRLFKALNMAEYKSDPVKKAQSVMLKQRFTAQVSEAIIPDKDSPLDNGVTIWQRLVQVYHQFDRRRVFTRQRFHVLLQDEAKERKAAPPGTDTTRTDLGVRDTDTGDENVVSIIDEQAWRALLLQRKHFLNCVQEPDYLPHTVKDRFGYCRLVRSSTNNERWHNELFKHMPAGLSIKHGNRLIKLKIFQHNLNRLQLYDQRFPFRPLSWSQVACVASNTTMEVHLGIDPEYPLLAADFEPTENSLFGLEASRVGWNEKHQANIPIAPGMISQNTAILFGGLVSTAVSGLAQAQASRDSGDIIAATMQEEIAVDNNTPIKWAYKKSKKPTVVANRRNPPGASASVRKPDVRMLRVALAAQQGQRALGGTYVAVASAWTGFELAFLKFAVERIFLRNASSSSSSSSSPAISLTSSLT